MKKLKQILCEATAIELKVGDKIRTKLGGQIPGIVTKIEGQQVFFDHLTAKYQTVWSGAKDKPKQYVAHISNVVKESYDSNELEEAAFDKAHLDSLRKAYSDLDKIDPTSHAYKKLITLLNSLPQDKLKSLASANIKFISPLAKNRIKKEVKEDDDRCWPGYKPTPGVKAYEKGSCMKEDDDSSEIEEGKYSQKTPWALVDTADNDKIIATGSDESVVKRSITTAHLPPLRVKDKSKLKIVKMKKIQQVGEILKEEAEHDGKKVTLNKPFRTPDGPKKFAVYVKNDKGNIVKVTFGDPNMEIKRDDPERRSNYRARHNCSDPGPKWKANYWSCKMWADKPVSKIVESAPPDAEIEKWILANKARFKTQYGSEKGLEVLYAKAWDMYNKK